MVRHSPGLTAVQIAASLAVALVAVPALLGIRFLAAVWRVIGLVFAGIVAVAGFLGSLVWIAAIGTGLALMVWALVTRPRVAEQGATPA